MLLLRQTEMPQMACMTGCPTLRYLSGRASPPPPDLLSPGCHQRNHSQDTGAYKIHPVEASHATPHCLQGDQPLFLPHNPSLISHTHGDSASIHTHGDSCNHGYRTFPISPAPILETYNSTSVVPTLTNSHGDHPSPPLSRELTNIQFSSVHHGNVLPFPPGPPQLFATLQVKQLLPWRPNWSLR